MGYSKECQVVIMNSSMDKEVQNIMKRLSNITPYVITGIKNKSLEIIDSIEIIRIYTQSGRVYVTTAKGDYLLKSRLYEIEKRLDPNVFVRISNSEIINLKMVKRFDLSFTGTIGVHLSLNIITYVSRRYVKTIK